MTFWLQRRKSRSLGRGSGLGMTSFLVAGLAAFSWAVPQQPATPQPGQSVQGDERAQVLRQRAEGSAGGNRAEIYMELARHEIELANLQFDSGTTETAQALIRQATDDAKMASDASIQSGSRLKNTELEMHKLARRLTAIQESVSVEDRSPVKAAVEKLFDLDRALLERIFQHKSKEKEGAKK